MEKIGGGGAGAAGSAGFASGVAGGVVWACALATTMLAAAIAGRRQFLIDTAIPLFERLGVTTRPDVQHTLCQAKICQYIKGLHVTLRRQRRVRLRPCTAVARRSRVGAPS